MMIINDESRVTNKLEVSLTDDNRVIIYNCHMLIVQVTEFDIAQLREIWLKFAWNINKMKQKCY
jgi:hypothetical protein